MLHDHQGRYPQAIKRYKQVIDRDSTYKEAYFNLGVLYKEAGDLDGAVKAYRHLTALDSTYANAYFNMGIILQEIEQYPDALSAFNQFVYYSSDAQLIGQVRQFITWLEQVVARQEEQGKIGWKEGSKTQ